MTEQLYGFWLILVKAVPVANHALDVKFRFQVSFVELCLIFFLEIKAHFRFRAPMSIQSDIFKLSCKSVLWNAPSTKFCLHRHFSVLFNDLIQLRPVVSERKCDVQTVFEAKTITSVLDMRYGVACKQLLDEEFLDGVQGAHDYYNPGHANAPASCMSVAVVCRAQLL